MSIFLHTYILVHVYEKGFFLIGETIKVLILTLIALKYLNRESKGKKNERMHYKENKLLIVKTLFQQNELQDVETSLN